MKAIGVVICNYNKSGCLVRCIESVLASDTDDLDVYVVDNASEDDSAARVRARFAGQVTLLENRENLGGSGGFNRGLRLVREKGYPYALCLDNDVVVDPAAIRKLREFLDAHPETGMAGSLVCHLEAPDIVQQFGLEIDWDRFCTVAKYTGRSAGGGALPEAETCDAAAACSLMVRREVLLRIGLMPEENFLYWDDTEWGFRCNRAGWNVAAVSASVVWHAMGAKKESVNTFPMYYAWRNWIRFFAHYTPAEFQGVMARAFVEELFAVACDGAYRGEESRSRTVFLACEDALHGVTGKAPEGRIFAIEDRAERERFAKLLSVCGRVHIVAGAYGGEALALAERLDALAPDGQIELWQEEADIPDGDDAPVLLVCGSVWDLEEDALAGLLRETQEGRRRLYLDLEGRIAADAQDARRIAACPAAKEVFLHAYLPVFTELAGRLCGEGETDAI